jgi:4-hydroxybenzoate polyprenyltransferase
MALFAYLALTLSYSLYLKTKLMLDIVALGGLFTLRVIGGGAAIQTELSFYLLCFSIFIFSSLGLVKRYAELKNLQNRNKQTARGRGYIVEDMLPVLIIGITLGNLSVFVMGLYIDSPLVNQFYNNPKLIWFLMPLLTYWLGRLWIITHRGMMNEDPLIFATKDKTSLLILAIAVVILYFAA